MHFLLVYEKKNCISFMYTDACSNIVFSSMLSLLFTNTSKLFCIHSLGFRLKFGVFVNAHIFFYLRAWIHLRKYSYVNSYEWIHEYLHRSCMTREYFVFVLFRRYYFFSGWKIYFIFALVSKINEGKNIAYSFNKKMPDTYIFAESRVKNILKW